MTPGMPASAPRASATFPRAAVPDAARVRRHASCGATSATRPRRSAPSGPRSSPRWPTGRSCAPPARRSRTTCSPTSTSTSCSSRSSVTARGGTVHWARDAAEANRDRHRRSCAATGADEVVKVKSMATQEIGLNEALAAAGIAALGDRPRRADRAARRRPAEPHPGAGDPPQPHRDPRHLPARDAAASDPGADRRAGASWPRPRGCTCARSSSRAEVAISGANFAVAETGTLAVVESEGNGRMCLTLPRDADHRDGHREGACRPGATSRCSCSCCRARRPASG